MTTAPPPPSTDSTSPSSRRRSRARPTSRPSSRCAKPAPDPTLAIIEPMPGTRLATDRPTCREACATGAQDSLRVAPTCRPERSRLRNRERPGIPARPADLKFPVMNRLHGHTPLGLSRHYARPLQVQTLRRPCEDGVEKGRWVDGLPRGQRALREGAQAW